MPYEVKNQKNGTTYYLHFRETESRGGKRPLYFFAKEVKEGAIDEMPAGYMVTENPRTGLPLLKRVE